MKKIIALVVLIVLGAIAWVVGKPYYDLHFSGKNLSEKYDIYVPTGSTVDDVATLLDGKIMDKAEFLDFADFFHGFADFADLNFANFREFLEKNTRF